MEKREKSLYAYIAEHVTDGALPEDFSLPDSNEGEGLRFADGAIDGMFIFHMAHEGISEEARPLMDEAIRAMCAGETRLTDQLFTELGQKARAIAIIDDFQQAILERKDEIDPDVLYRYAVHAVLESTDRECVKFGLCVLELVTSDDEVLRDVIRTLALSDEFTIFALFVIRASWENANEEIFRIAQKVSGWGRIHAVERLSPATPEIRDWLLREGVHNRVLPAYSADLCWGNSGAQALLDSEDLSYEDFVCIRDILEGLLDEGPCPGISLFENGEDIVRAFLQKADAMPLTQADTPILDDIFTKYEGENDEIAQMADKLRQKMESGASGITEE